MDLKVYIRVAALIFLFVLLASHADACTSCFGNPKDAQTKGMNAAIFTLLGITSGVLAIAGGVILHAISRNRKALR